MAKKTRMKKNQVTQEPAELKSDISPVIESMFKTILKIMSWTVGICFLIIITLPNFDFYYLDAIIKFVFYLGVFCLLLFILFEFLGESFKRFLSKRLL